jgi:hypothetical protein
MSVAVVRVDRAWPAGARCLVLDGSCPCHRMAGPALRTQERPIREATTEWLCE